MAQARTQYHNRSGRRYYARRASVVDDGGAEPEVDARADGGVVEHMLVIIPTTPPAEQRAQSGLEADPVTERRSSRSPGSGALDGWRVDMAFRGVVASLTRPARTGFRELGFPARRAAWIRFDTRSRWTAPQSRT
jgi:hypothetical protein